MRDSWDREDDDYYYRDSRRDQGGAFFEFLGIIAFFSVLGWALRGLFKRSPKAFDDRDMEAFQHAENVRKELDAVKALVSPKVPDPDYSLTVSATKKKV
jgi:hypothetical protein